MILRLRSFGRNYVIIRKATKKSGGSRISTSMREFDNIIRECELVDPSLRNASLSQICKIPLFARG